jgi:hypothetical protein
MDDVRPVLTKLPRLSDEAISLFFAGVGYASPVDLRPFVALQGDYRPCVVKAAIRWGLPPEAIEIV